MSTEGAPDPGLERMVMRELRDLLVSLCSAQPVRFGSVPSTPGSTVKSTVSVLLVLVTLGGVVAVIFIYLLKSA